MKKTKIAINLNIILAIIIVLLICGLLGQALLSNIINWTNKDAIEQYYIMKKKYGTPRITSFAKGGMAVWTKDKLLNTCFERVELIDESVAHCVPKPHRDFLYHYVNYEIPSDKVLEVISLSGSVAYDPLKKLLRARCGSEEANIATLYLATSIGNSRISLKKVQEEKLYKKTIVSTSDSQNVQIYYTRLCKYIKDQPGNPKWTGFFPLAFPEGCCEGYDAVLNKCGIENFHSDNHSIEDHKLGKITNHTLENHLSDKSDKSGMNHFTDKSDKSENSINLVPVLV